MLQTCVLSSHYDGAKPRLCPEDIMIWITIDGNIIVTRGQAIERWVGNVMCGTKCQGYTTDPNERLGKYAIQRESRNICNF